MREYTPQPIDTSDIILPDDLLELTEKIAKNTHDVWAAGRMTDVCKKGVKMEDNRYVFISYSTRNQASADAMRNLLGENKIKTWMAPGDIPPGSKYAQVISRAVRECACFVLMLSKDAQNSVWVAKEVERAVNYRKPIIPIQIEDVTLNDEFELYISTDQVIATPKIDIDSVEMKKVISTLHSYIDSLGSKNDIKSYNLHESDGKNVNDPNTILRRNVCPISFNTMPGKEYIMAKETNPNLAYRKGPIEVKGENSFWILTIVNNICPDENAIAENVRLSMSIKRISPNDTVVESVILCENAEPKIVKQSIHFLGNEPFELEYYKNSAFLYSEYYGLYGTKGLPLNDDILSDQGTILGFWDVDGKIPGGLHNSVTVSIKVFVKKVK